MEHKPLISMIIPVYNVERYLRKCMSSVMAQTYENYEVILVDDGSTDSSGKLCDEYAELYKKVRAFHKKNGGLSDARNFGVQYSRGQYISFVDSDDFISEDHLQYLYDLLIQNNVDISCASFKNIYKEDTDDAVVSEKEKVYCLTAEEAVIKTCYNDGLTVSAWAKLYKTDLVKKNPFPVGRNYEDLATACKLFYDSKKVVIGSRKIYFYFIREGSIMRSSVNEKQFDVLWAAEEQLDFVIDHFPKSIHAAKVRCAGVAVGMFSLNAFFSCKKVSREYYARVRNYLAKYSKDYMSDKKIPIVYRISCFVSMQGYYIAKCYWFVYNFLKNMIKNALK